MDPIISLARDGCNVPLVGAQRHFTTETQRTRHWESKRLIEIDDEMLLAMGLTSPSVIRSRRSVGRILLYMLQNSV